MQIVSFSRIEDRGAGLVAVFTMIGGKEFCLNRAGLATLINNIKNGLGSNPERDASVEMAALAELRRREQLSTESQM